MTARIYKPAKTAMQSGTAKTKEWVLDYEPEQPREIEPLMGWTSSGDMRQQVQLRFDSAEEAIAYCERHGIAYQVFQSKPLGAARHLLRRQLRLQPPRPLDALIAAYGARSSHSSPGTSRRARAQHRSRRADSPITRPSLQTPIAWRGSRSRSPRSPARR